MLTTAAAAVAPVAVASAQTLDGATDGRLDPFEEPPRTSTAFADLNGDGRPEMILFNEGTEWCGTGGCNLVVLTRAGGRWTVVADTTVSQSPIYVMEEKSRGWSDLGVTVGGGGATPGVARLRYDGTRYPANPSTAPRVMSLNQATLLTTIPVDRSP